MMTLEEVNKLRRANGRKPLSKNQYDGATRKRSSSDSELLDMTSVYESAPYVNSSDDSNPGGGGVGTSPSCDSD